MDPQDRVLIAMIAAALGLTLVFIAIAMGEAALGLTLAFIVIAMAEAAVERERQKTRQMEQSLSALQAALQEKERERAMLKTKKKEMLAEEAANRKLVDNFMKFINDPEIAENFDEKGMMNTILHRIKSDCRDRGDNGGFAGGDNVPDIKLDLKGRAIAMINNSDGSSSSNNGGFTGDNAGINNAPENAGEEATMAADEETNSEGEGAGWNGKRH